MLGISKILCHLYYMPIKQALSWRWSPCPVNRREFHTLVTLQMTNFNCKCTFNTKLDRQFMGRRVNCLWNVSPLWTFPFQPWIFVYRRWECSGKRVRWRCGMGCVVDNQSTLYHNNIEHYIGHLHKIYSW